MKDKLIEKLKELAEQYKLFHDSIISPGVVKVIYDTWMNYNESLESEIASLESDLVKEQEPEGVTAEIWFDKNQSKYKGIKSRHYAIEMLNDFASSKQIDKRKFLKDFNSWMCGKQYDGKIPLIDTCITEYLNNK